MDGRKERRSRGGRWLRAGAAAEILGVSERTVRRWADAGVLPCRRTPGGQRQFLRDDLYRFLTSGVTSATLERERELLQLGREIARIADRHEALHLVAARGAAVLGAATCVALVWGEQGAAFTPLTGDAEGRMPPEVHEALAVAGATDEAQRVPGHLVIPFGLDASSRGCLVFAGEGIDQLAGDDLLLASYLGDLAARAVQRLEAEEASREQLKYVQSLLSAGRSITSSLVTYEVLDAVAREVVTTLGASDCTIWEYVSQDDVLVERVGFGRDEPPAVEPRVLRLPEWPREREVMLGEAPVVETLSDPFLDERRRASMQSRGEQTSLSLPFRYGGKALGMLVVCEREVERRYSDMELQVAIGLANQAAAAIHNARLFQDLERRNEELEERARRQRLLRKLSLELSSSLDPDTVLNVACRRVTALLDVVGCAVWAWHGEEVECIAVWVDGESRSDQVWPRHSLALWPAMRRIVEGGETLSISSSDDPRLGDAERELLGEYGERAVILTPLRAGDRILGVFGVMQYERGYESTAEEEATVEVCARMTALAFDNAMLYERQAEQTQRVSALLEAARAITSSLDIHHVLSTLVRTAAQSLGCPGALIYEYDAESDTMALRSIYQEQPIVGVDVDKPFPLDSYLEGRDALEAPDVFVETISDASLPIAVLESMLEQGEKTCLVVPLRFHDRPLGLLTLIETGAERVFSEADLEFARGFGEQAAMAVHNAQQFESVKGLHRGNLRALSSALTAKDPYTVGHAARVAAYAVLLAAELGWTSRAMQQLEDAAYLHDIGKIAVAERVLLKSGPLSDDEWTLMRQHPAISADIIESLLDDDFVAGVRHHHERWDGEGYPNGLAGEVIPLIARILGLVDAYDAMSSRRVYRQPLPYLDCVAELRRCAGEQFDPLLVEMFIRVLARLAAQRDRLQAAADEAAAQIDVRDHLMLREGSGAGSEEFGRVLATLQRVADRHPEVERMLTEAPIDQLNCMIVVDSDLESSPRQAGELVQCAGLEYETFAGKHDDTIFVVVDRWGTWISAATPIRDEEGVIVGLVAARGALGGHLPAGLLAGAVATTFSEVMRTAGARQTRVELESMTDALTGLYNHRRFHELLREAVAGARANGRRLTVLFCDIDDFKRLNDQHGHLVGDDVLRRVSCILIASVRRGDVAARYGGDEFGLLLYGADVHEALEVAERIRQRVADVQVGRGATVTISIGVSELGDHHDATELLASADEALYAAKQRGRNLVMRADRLAAPPH